VCERGASGPLTSSTRQLPPVRSGFAVRARLARQRPRRAALVPHGRHCVRWRRVRSPGGRAWERSSAAESGYAWIPRQVRCSIEATRGLSSGLWGLWPTGGSPCARAPRVAPWGGPGPQSQTRSTRQCMVRKVTVCGGTAS